MTDKTDSAYEIAVYYFPQYHPDQRNDVWQGQGWTEWDVLQAAHPRYPGHRQPIVPAWGYFNEADPVWAAREIDLAADHGITSFLYDWYWYDDKPFLHDALENGFLAAPNALRLKFALMWANHNWLDLYPAPSKEMPTVLTSGRIKRASFERMTDYIIEHYFSQPNYLCIDGEPYFSLFELGGFIEGMGSMSEALAALESFRAKTVAAGFPGLHINTMVQRANNLPGEAILADPAQTIRELRFSSATTYNWYQLYEPETFPQADYVLVAKHNYAAWEELATRFSVPYYPGVTMGWDPTPRTVQSVEYARETYPWTAVYEGNTPEAFKEALYKMKSYLDRSQGTQKLFTINAWNEWTEGSYLLPDTVHGTAYLEAIREVFGTA